MKNQDNIINTTDSDRIGMSADFVVYESPSSVLRDPKDTERFEDSFRKLSDAGIIIERVTVNSQSELCPEAAEYYGEQGDACLPMGVYLCTVICSGRYPSDQEIVDYIDVPHGILNTERWTLAQANDLPPDCTCRRSSR